MERLLTQLRPHAGVGLAGVGLVALITVWAVQDGGYDPSTWYWGALVLLGVLAALLISGVGSRVRISRPMAIAIGAFALYVAWSYLSISWAASPGDALQGSNRALLYLLLFTMFAVLPWTAEAALASLVLFALAVGTVAVVLQFRLASADQLQNLFSHGRLLAPTGYINATAALFTMGALVSCALAAHRRLPGLLRGLLLALAAAEIPLAVIVQSRGWLFTLPLVLLAAFAVVHQRVRMALALVLPIGATLIPVHRLLEIYHSHLTSGFGHAAMRAGQASLLLCGVVLVVGTLLAWTDGLIQPPQPSKLRRRALGALVACLAVAAAATGAVVATHGHPFSYAKRQWNGFSRVPPPNRTGSYFGVVGSGRYDFWRVSLDAFVAHPIGGLGQDNFDDYYVSRRRTSEEPSWTHSLEMRLLAHTGIVGFLLFAVFVAAAISVAVRARRRGGELTRWAAGVALLPLAVWLVHGSIDWFWEMPALTGPALGFLAMAGRLSAPAVAREVDPIRRQVRFPAVAAALAGVVAFLACLVVLGFPYLSVHEYSAALASSGNPSSALSDLATAAKLNPLSAAPGRVGGSIALQTGQYQVAEARFNQSISRERGGWFAWLGAGLAASALGDPARAHHDFQMANSINSQEPAVKRALALVYSRHPLTTAQAFKLFVLET